MQVGSETSSHLIPKPAFSVLPQINSNREIRAKIVISKKKKKE